MELKIAIEVYFGRLNDVTVPAVQYRDASSYERLEATWTDERTLPSEAELTTYWNETGQTLYEVSLLPVPTAEEVALAEIMAGYLDLEMALAGVMGMVLDMADINGLAE